MIDKKEIKALISLEELERFDQLDEANKMLWSKINNSTRTIEELQETIDVWKGDKKVSMTLTLDTSYMSGCKMELGNVRIYSDSHNAVAYLPEDCIPKIVDEIITALPKFANKRSDKVILMDYNKAKELSSELSVKIRESDAKLVEIENNKKTLKEELNKLPWIARYFIRKRFKSNATAK